MQNSTTEPIDASNQFCPNSACSASGKIGEGNIRVHNRKRQLYRCTRNQSAYHGKTWVEIDKQGQPSKWVTLRACVVLKAVYG